MKVTKLIIKISFEQPTVPCLVEDLEIRNNVFYENYVEFLENDVLPYFPNLKKIKFSANDDVSFI